MFRRQNYLVAITACHLGRWCLLSHRHVDNLHQLAAQTSFCGAATNFHSFSSPRINIIQYPLIHCYAKETASIHQIFSFVINQSLALTYPGKKQTHTHRYKRTIMRLSGGQCRSAKFLCCISSFRIIKIG